MTAVAQSNVELHNNNTAKQQQAADAKEGKQIIAERFKTKMCRGYLKTGACPYEHRCMFAHGTHEIRSKSMNIADGVTSEEAVKVFQRRLKSQSQPPKYSQAIAEQNMQLQTYGEQPPSYSAYMAPKLTSSMGVLGEDEEDEMSNSSGEYSDASQYYGAASYPVSRSSNYGSYGEQPMVQQPRASHRTGCGSSYHNNPYALYADYEGPCQCDECLRAEQPCECVECATAAAAAVCPCEECGAARQQLSSCHHSSCGSSDSGVHH